MRLILLHPHVAFRDCAHCRAWQYLEEGEHAGTVKIHHGQPMKRVGKPPCGFVKADGSTRCPKGTPTAGVALTARNLAAYGHYLECKAVGRFPADPIVERNAGIIAHVEDSLARAQRAEQHEMTLALMEVRRGR